MKTQEAPEFALSMVRPVDLDRCPHCINCKSFWTAGMNTSCHDGCDKYQAWREEVRKW